MDEDEEGDERQRRDEDEDDEEYVDESVDEMVTSDEEYTPKSKSKVRCAAC